MTPSVDSTTAPAAPPERPVFTLKLKPMPGTDGRLALRALLKTALRQHGLVCLVCHEEAGE